jgi:DNA replication protein DnaC
MIEQIARIKTRVLDTFDGLDVSRRKVINATVFASPERNYIFSGKGGLGKSYLASAVGDIAELYEYKVHRTSGSMWEHEVRENDAASFDKKRALELSGTALKSAEPCLIIFDEVSRVRKTEFMVDRLQDLLDGIKAGSHQIIATTNLDLEEFKAWAGDSLWWRLTRRPEGFEGRFGGLGCHWVSFKNRGESNV